jgi:hypothetical protein
MSAELLNERWRKGAPSSDLSKGGVILHTVDGVEEDGAQFWRPRASFPRWIERNTMDRVSASMVYRGHSTLYAGAYHYGVVFRPYSGLTCLLCAYAADGGSSEKRCHPPGPSASCVPGCLVGTANFARCTGHCPFGPAALGTMLQQHRQSRNPTYNELVLDPECWRANLPHSVEAIFFTGPMPGLATAARAAMIAKYKLSRDQVPLVRFDPSDTNAPFSPVD